MPTRHQLPDGRWIVLARYEEHDPASRGYPMLEAAAKVTSIDHGPGPILDQGEMGSCVGNEKAAALNTVTLRTARGLPAKATREFAMNTETDAVAIYDTATRLDRVPGVHPPSDTGTTGLAGCKAALRLGYYVGDYRHTFSMGSLISGLMLGPAGLGTIWTRNMFRPDKRGYVAPLPGEEPLGGHQWLVYGWDNTAGDLLAQQSWGTGWGVKGLFRVRGEVAEYLLITRRGDAQFLRPIQPKTQDGSVQPWIR